jgi:hypothetical protein
VLFVNNARAVALPGGKKKKKEGTEGVPLP